MSQSYNGLRSRVQLSNLGSGITEPKGDHMARKKAVKKKRSVNKLHKRRLAKKKSMTGRKKKK
jgi:hypothetical protein